MRFSLGGDFYMMSFVRGDVSRRSPLFSSRPRNLITSILIFGACLVNMQSTARANLITDPGFETAVNTTFTGAIGDGWNALQGTIAILNNSQSFGAAHSGVQFADLDYAGAVNQLSQTLATVAGQAYTISFWLSDDVGGNPFSVSFGVTSLFSGNTPALGSGNYEFLTFDTVASGSSTDLTFTSQYTFKGGGVGAAISDVSLTPTGVPAPATWTMVLAAAGLLALASVRRVRR